MNEILYAFVKILICFILVAVFSYCKHDKQQLDANIDKVATDAIVSADTISYERLDTVDYIPKELRETAAELAYDPVDISLSQEFADTIYVRDASELKEAIHSDRAIVLLSDLYELSNNLNIVDINKLSLVGDGMTTIRFTNPMSSTVFINGSSDITINNIKLEIGYDPAKRCIADRCHPNYLLLRKSYDIVLWNVQMNDSPLSGMTLDQVSNAHFSELRVENSHRFQVSFVNCENIQFQNSTFTNLKIGDNGFVTYGKPYKKIYFDRVEFSDIMAESNEESGPSLFEFNPILYRCKFKAMPGISLGVDEKYVIKTNIE